jgi:GT2 family glycosyltransferase
MESNSPVNMANINPTVSIIIPCRNEFDYIEDCIESVLNQKNVPGEIEIIVVDGMSDDGSKEILNKIESLNSNVIILENKKKVTPVAFNLGIKKATGKFICIMGAHAVYNKYYLANSLQLMKDFPDVYCVGGPIISKGKSWFGKAVAYTMSSFMGVGNANHRFPDYEGFAEMACFPFFRNEVFSKIGYYNESLIRNQDDEFCSRLRNSGYKIYISPTIKSTYFVRDSVQRLIRQYFGYGLFKPLSLRNFYGGRRIRHFIPMIFVLYLLSLPISFYCLCWLYPLMIYILLLVVTIIISGLHFVSRLYLLITFPIIHISYGCGFLIGLLKLVHNRKFFRKIAIFN